VHQAHFRVGQLAGEQLAGRCLHPDLAVGQIEFGITAPAAELADQCRVDVRKILGRLFNLLFDHFFDHNGLDPGDPVVELFQFVGAEFVQTGSLELFRPHPFAQGHGTGRLRQRAAASQKQQGKKKKRFHASSRIFVILS